MLIKNPISLEPCIYALKVFKKDSLLQGEESCIIQNNFDKEKTSQALRSVLRTHDPQLNASSQLAGIGKIIAKVN